MGVILEAVFNLVMLFYYILEAIVVPWIPIKYRSKDVSGQIALVTGAGGGIGRLIAIGLAKLGCKVVCWDIAKQGMHGSLGIELDWIIKIAIYVTANEETVKQIQMSNGIAYAYQVDLTKREEIYQFAERVKKEIGKVKLGGNVSKLSA